MRTEQQKINLTDLKSPHYTGTQVNYFYVCKRKLWFFSNQIELESESDTVFQGRVLHNYSYERTQKEIEFDNIKIDWFDFHDNIIHEVKKSDSVGEAHEAQVLYYIYYLKQLGVVGVKGEIDYPKLKKRVSVELTPEKERKMEETLKNIDQIIQLSSPPPIEVKRSFCKSCSYFQLCYS
ncbi:MAG: CRISPR-associated protein Cas4 [Candidatus Kryptoniota bacterium]